MKTAILSTGSELVNGTITDTNASWMARHLLSAGIRTSQIVVIGDSRTQLAAVLKSLWNEYDLVICTGGLGPTTDDITAAAVADALNVPLNRFPEAQAQIEARFAARHFPMATINLKQADLPEGCVVLENSEGTAPGFRVVAGDCQLYFLPGVPAEMKSMFHRHILPLATSAGPRIFSARCTTFGIGESVLQERLLPLETAHPEVVFSYRADYPILTTTISGTNQDKVHSIHQRLVRLLDEWIITTEDKPLAQVVGELLAAQGLTVATAESCTGGMICNELTHVAGASQYVLGSVVAYDNRIKNQMLGVSSDLLETYGAVSEEVVRAMAIGVQQRMGVDAAIATSGIAGPGGGTDQKPVGTVHIAVALRSAIFHKKYLFKGYSRTKVKTATTWTALQLLQRLLLEKK
ncbi:MAG: CinA family nicotinamide mononucleotide deamidase-related protein [Deltaproteobacteria bacterium]|nr:CinA family nicotinamide mononucleotide deamidase-related protein [Deltaproteobacteria bacterium]